MQEGNPIPITRGIEIQKEQLEYIAKQALNRYRHLVALDKIVEARLDDELSRHPAAPDQTSTLLSLFEQKHVLEEVGRELETLIVGNFNHQDDLTEKWGEIDQKMSAVQGGTSPATGE